MATSPGIYGYGTYLPYWRLSHATIGEALGKPTRSRGTRAVAGYDEDTTTLAVEASRRALGFPARAAACTSVTLATASPVYAEKTNATALHAALGLPSNARAADANGAVRSGVMALLAAVEGVGTSLVALADVRIGPAGSPEESGNGDGAAAFVVGDGSSAPLIAELVSTASATREFLDRWRAPGEPWSSSWEERFGEEIYTELGKVSLANALKSGKLAPSEVDHFAVVGLSTRAAKGVHRSSGIRAEATWTDILGSVGNCGTAHPGLALAALLDAAGPDEVIALTVLADGADTVIFRTTHEHQPRSGPNSIEGQVAGPTGQASYADFLTWRGLLQRQQARRPDPDRAVAPATNRQLEWKFGFTASACEKCGVRHLPPQRVCMSCGTADEMRLERLADSPARIATYTIDHLAYSLAPPVVGAVLDFDGGGRYQCELTDLDVETIDVGQRVEMTFRHVSDASGIRNYFWKARPIRSKEQA